MRRIHTRIHAACSPCAETVESTGAGRASVRSVDQFMHCHKGFDLWDTHDARARISTTSLTVLMRKQQLCQQKWLKVTATRATWRPDRYTAAADCSPACLTLELLPVSTSHNSGLLLHETRAHLPFVAMTSR